MTLCSPDRSLPDRSLDPEPSVFPPYIDGYNTMIEGNQGQGWLDVKAKLIMGTPDAETYECDDTLQAKLRYMFNI
jgi:hypothetical protein